MRTTPCFRHSALEAGTWCALWGIRFRLSDSGYQIPGIRCRGSSFGSTWRVEGGGWRVEGGGANRVAAEAGALPQDVAERSPLQEVQHRRALHLRWGAGSRDLGLEQTHHFRFSVFDFRV